MNAEEKNPEEKKKKKRSRRERMGKAEMRRDRRRQTSEIKKTAPKTPPQRQKYENAR